MSVVPAFSRQMQSAVRSLLQIEIWVVGGMVTLSMLLPRFLPAAVLTVAGFWLLRGLSAARVGPYTGADTAISALGFISLVNLWITPDFAVSLPQVLRLWSGIGLYYAVVHWAATPERLRRLMHMALLAGLGLALAAPFTVAWPMLKLPILPHGLYERFQLLAADSIHPNVLGGTLALLLPLALARLLFWRGSRPGEIALALIAAAGMSAALLISLSRGAILAVGIAVILLPVLRGRWGWLAPAGLAAAAGFLIFRLGWSRVVDAALAGGSVSGFNGRLDIWSRAVMILRDFPFTGVGMGLFGSAADRLYPFSLYWPEVIFHAHNLFLQVGVDLGLPGLAAWLAALVAGLAAGWTTYRRGRRSADGFLAALGAGLLGSQIALIVHGLTDAAVWGMVRPAPLVWLVWGLAMAGKSVVSDQQSVVRDRPSA